jgi:putative endonuclease
MASQNSRQARGQQVEMLAEDYLTRQGLQLLQRNFHTRYGEIDRIFWHGPVLVFLEVRYRHSGLYGTGLESITPRKQQRLQLAASQFLQQLNLSPCPDCRFDVISAHGEPVVMEWHPNAF